MAIFCFSYYKVKLTLESEDREQLESSVRYLQENLPEGQFILCLICKLRCVWYFTRTRHEIETVLLKPKFPGPHLYW